MGVLACDRKNCENIMCDNILDINNNKSYYICDECLVELKVLKGNWPTSTTVANLHDLIDEFMNSAKGSHLTVETEEEFTKILRERIK
jgi:hypothetical protein